MVIVGFAWPSRFETAGIGTPALTNFRGVRVPQRMQTQPLEATFSHQFRDPQPYAVRAVARAVRLAENKLLVPIRLAVHGPVSILFRMVLTQDIERAGGTENRRGFFHFVDFTRTPSARVCPIDFVTFMMPVSKSPTVD